MTPTIPMPGALRWREMYPLIDGDGSCSLIYDLERAAVLEVPEDLRFYVAPALETGDLDDGLLSWLVQEDLLTAENQAGWGGDAAAALLREAFPSRYLSRPRSTRPRATRSRIAVDRSSFSASAKLLRKL